MTTGYRPGPRYRYQPWKRRHSLAMHIGADVESAAELACSPLVHCGARIRFRRQYRTSPGASFGALFSFGDSTTAPNYDFKVQIGTTTRAMRATASRYASPEVGVSHAAQVIDGDEHDVSFRIGWAGAMSLAVDGAGEVTGTAPLWSAATAAATPKMILNFGSGTIPAEWEISRFFLAQRLYTHAEATEILDGTKHIFPGEGGLYLHYPMNEGTGATVANQAGTLGDLTIAANAADWVLDGATNDNGGPLSDPGLAISQQFAQVADGVNWATGEVLLRTYSAGVPQIYAVSPFEVEWPSINASGGSINARGNEVGGASTEVSSEGGIFSDLQPTSEAVTATIPWLETGEGRQLKAVITRAAETWRAGAKVNSQPIAIIDAGGPAGAWSDDERCRFGRPVLRQSAVTWRAVAATPYVGTATERGRAATVTVQDGFVDI